MEEELEGKDMDEEEVGKGKDEETRGSWVVRGCG